MKRKVVKHGPSTLIVSLPAKWVKRYRVQPGQYLDVKEKEKGLLINIGEGTESLSLSIDVTGLQPRLVDRFLARAYQAGYDEIHITHNAVSLLGTIQTKTNELLGFEVVEQDSRSCVVKMLAQRTELSFDQALRRGFLIAKTMLDDLRTGYTSGDASLLQNVFLADFELNKMTYYCLRMLAKQQPLNPEETHRSHILYHLVEILEDLGDNFKEIGEHLAQTDMQNAAIKKLLADVHELYQLSYDYVYNPKKALANETQDRYKSIKQDVVKIIPEKLSEQDAHSAILLWEAAKIMYHFVTMRLDHLAD